MVRKKERKEKESVFAKMPYDTWQASHQCSSYPSHRFPTLHVCLGLLLCARCLPSMSELPSPSVVTVLSLVTVDTSPLQTTVCFCSWRGGGCLWTCSSWKVWHMSSLCVHLSACIAHFHRKALNLFSLKMKTSLVTPHNQTLPRIKTDRSLFPTAAVITLQVHCLLMLISLVTVAQILYPAEVLRKHVLLPFRTQPVGCPFIEMPPFCPGGWEREPLTRGVC